MRERGVRVVVLTSMPPGGLSQARYLCKRMRAGVPDARIVVGRWSSPEDAAEIRAALISAGADSVATRLLELRAAVLEVARTEPSVTPQRAA